MKYILIIFSIVVLFSCRTTKEITKTEIRTDSTAVRKYDSLYRVYRLDSASFQNTLNLMNENFVTFECPACGDSSDNTVIEFDSLGFIKRVEGRVKSIKTQSDLNKRESYYWKTMYDSLTHVQRKDSVTVKKEIEIREKIVKKTFIPWWVYLVLAIAGILWINERFRIFKIPFITKK